MYPFSSLSCSATILTFISPFSNLTGRPKLLVQNLPNKLMVSSTRSSLQTSQVPSLLDDMVRHQWHDRQGMDEFSRKCVSVMIDLFSSSEITLSSNGNLAGSAIIAAISDGKQVVVL